MRSLAFSLRPPMRFSSRDCFPRCRRWARAKPRVIQPPAAHAAGKGVQSRLKAPRSLCGPLSNSCSSRHSAPAFHNTWCPRASSRPESVLGLDSEPQAGIKAVAAAQPQHAPTCCLRQRVTAPPRSSCLLFLALVPSRLSFLRGSTRDLKVFHLWSICSFNQKPT